MPCNVAACTRLDDRYDLLTNEFQDSPEVPLFYRPEFLRLHQEADDRVFFFQVRDRARNKIVGAAPFYDQGTGLAQSPKRGSFGGYYFGVAEEAAAVTDVFILAVERSLAAAGISAVSLTLPPQAYDPEGSAVLTSALLRLGYQPTRADLNYARAVAREPEAFLAAVNAGNRKNVRRCARAGYTFRPLGPEELAGAYEVIAENRARHNYHLSMTWEALDAMNRRLPGAVLAFGVFDGVQLGAASICVVIEPRILYVFYWGERADYESPSTVPFLAMGLHDYCAAAGFQVLDVGTSMVGNAPNLGLIRFKRSLGFTASLKLAFHKRLPDRTVED